MLKIAWAPIYVHPLPDGHRFPMEKYELLPKQLLYEGTVEEDTFFEPDILSEDLILSTHKEDYWKKLKNQTLTKKEERKTGFPLSPELVQREITILQGTVDCCHYALKNGVAMNIAGGTHHAYTDRGEGFCLLNDIAVSSNYLLKEGLANKILVVDLDVHQGNGTAEIFANEPSVFTFSMHGEKNYPMHKEQSDFDLPLPDYVDDATYLKQLDYHLKRLLDEVEPDFIHFQSGVDVLESDKLGRMGLTVQGCRERDRLVLETCKQNNLPVVCTMGGGYSEEIRIIVDAHANTYRLAQEIFF